MGLPSIKEKLQTILLKKTFEETDVVYVLSRIRKILEIDNVEKKYKKLKFYCNWALHKQIDDADPVLDELPELTEKGLRESELITLKTFYVSLKSFLNEYKLRTDIYDNPKLFNQFSEKLLDIFEDTPIVLKKIKKRELTIRREGGERREINGQEVSIPIVRFNLTEEK